MSRSPQWRIYYHRMWGQLSTTCSNVLKQPNRELLVAVNHNQLRTMASETVDPIDWSHPPPPPVWALPPERLMHSLNQCNISGIQTCNRSMQGNHLAYAATQGMRPRKEWALHSFRSFAHCHAASTVIPQLPNSTFTSSIQPNLGLPRTRLPLLRPSTPYWPYGTHPFFPHAQTISILSDLLYLLTLFLFQLSYAPLHS